MRFRQALATVAVLQRRIMRGFVVLACVLPQGTMDPHAQHSEASADTTRTLVETSLGKIDFWAKIDSSTRVTYSTASSLDFRHIAHVTRTDHGMAVVVDGRKGPDYDAVLGVGLGRTGASYSRVRISGSDRTPVFSPDGRRLAYVAQRATKRFAVVDGKEGKSYDDVGHHLFSPDSKRFAYQAMADGKELVVVDEIEGKRYKEVVRLTFSPDSGRFAYIARDDRGLFLVQDATEVPAVQGVYGIDGYEFSPDGRRLAYAGVSDEVGNFLVVDDMRMLGTASDHPQFTFSPDSRRFAFFAFAAKDGNTSYPVVDGKEWRQYRRPSNTNHSFFFSPDSKNVAFVARRGEQECVVLNGTAGSPYDSVDLDLRFSPDSRRLAYFARTKGRRLMIVDGRESTVAVDEYLTSFGFSDDSRHYFFVARDEKGWAVILDGVGGKRYDFVFAPVFSPHGATVAYGVQQGKDEPYTEFVVMGGLEGKPYDDIASITFSPDGRRIAYLAVKGGKRFVVVDSTEGKAYDARDDAPMALDRVVWDSADRLHYFAIKGSEVFLVEETLGVTARR